MLQDSNQDKMSLNQIDNEIGMREAERARIRMELDGKEMQLTRIRQLIHQSEEACNKMQQSANQL